MNLQVTVGHKITQEKTHETEVWLSLYAYSMRTTPCDSFACKLTETRTCVHAYSR